MKKPLLLAFCICFILSGFAQDWEEAAKVLPTPYLHNTRDTYGHDVASDGVYAVIGSSGYMTAKGCAYVLHFNGSDWETIARLTGSDSEEGDGFGTSVDISGDNIVVGAYRAGDNQGAVYFFEKPVSGWEDMTETAIFTASNGGTTDYFGSDVAISVDTIVVGAFNTPYLYLFQKSGGGWKDTTETAIFYNSDNNKLGDAVDILNGYIVAGGGDIDNDSGAVYVFHKTTTASEVAKLTASEREYNGHFGESVDMAGDIIVVGGYYCDDDTGAVYIFRKPAAGWTDTIETAILTASDRKNYQAFGRDVCIYGDYIAIGVSKDDKNGDNSGAVYIFKKPASGWKDTTETAQLTASDAEVDDGLGRSVCLSNGRLFSGSTGNDDHGDNSGAVYLFEKTGPEWTTMQETAKFVPEKYLHNTYDYFGVAASMDGEYAVITAPGYKNYQGCAYVLHFNGSDWEKIARLTASDGKPDDYFGTDVGIYGTDIIISAKNADGNTNKTGAVYIFERPAGGWKDTTETLKIIASDGMQDDRFGEIVAINGEYCAVGAPGNDFISNSSGAIYIFEKAQNGWQDTTASAKLTSTEALSYDYLGNHGLAVSGDYVIAGHYNDDYNGMRTGSAYLFQKPAGGWKDTTETAKLIASDGQQYDKFGYHIGMHGETIVIGAPKNGDMGAAFIYEKPADGWKDTVQSAKLTPSDGQSGDFFGNAVDIEGGYIIIGGGYSNKAYIYKKPATGWVDTTETIKLSPSDGEGNEEFGNAVSVAGEKALVCAPGDVENGNMSGAAYFFIKGDTSGAEIKTIEVVENQLYPNPTSGTVYLPFENARAIMVYDITGKAVIRQSGNDNMERVDLSGLSDGLYFVMIQTKNQLFTRKVMKH